MIRVFKGKTAALSLKGYHAWGERAYLALTWAKDLG